MYKQKNSFYRYLKLPKETKKLIRQFRKLKKELLIIPVDYSFFAVMSVSAFVSRNVAGLS